LPTEAEWEYAARGGIKSNNYEYAGCNLEEELKYYAWYEKNSNNITRPVGQLHPNELGLYDMSGNVWEWCEDSEGSDRVLRGGSWFSIAGSVRVSGRGNGSPDDRSYSYGFRLALSSK
jgi:formylglycine-generating enzyme required for sulfatase activity